MTVALVAFITAWKCVPVAFRGLQFSHCVEAKLDKHLEQEDVVCFEPVPVVKHVKKGLEICFRCREKLSRAKPRVLLERISVARLVERGLLSPLGEQCGNVVVIK
jgi:hypothetical protein